MYKTILISIFGLLAFYPSYGGIKDFNHSISALRDSSWKRYDDDMWLDFRLQAKRNQLTHEEYLILHENYLRKMRADGLEIWKARPNDKNRYSWLTSTIGVNLPSYYDYALNSFDKEDKAQWDKLYPRLKNEYMNYIDNEVPPEQRFPKKFEFDRTELVGDITYNKLIFQVTGKKFDLLSYGEPLIKLIKKAPSKNYFITTLHDIPEQILMKPDDYGISNSDIAVF